MNGLLDTLEISAVVVDRTLHVRYVSPGAQVRFGVGESLLGTPVGSIETGLPGPDMADCARRALAGERCLDRAVQAPDGRWYSLCSRPADQGVAMALMDVDVYWRREEEHRNQEAFLDAIFENLPAMIFVKDAEHLRFVRVNRAGEAIMGFSRDELLGKTDHDFFPTDEADFFTGKDRAVLERGMLHDIPEEPIHTPRGLRFLHTRKVPIVDPASGEPRFLLGISQDITERKYHEEQLRSARMTAEQANRAKSEFLAVMSHEIRTPLNGVVGMASLLAETELNEDQADMVATINNSSQRLLKLVGDVLDLSKIEAGELELDPEPFSLETAVQAVCGMFRQRAADKGITLSLSVSGEVPARVTGDEGRLQQVLTNLVSNAVRLTHAGSVEVRLSGHRVNGHFAARIAVQDTGPGLPPDAIGTIFEPFRQIRTHKRASQPGTTGLGLAIAHRLVALMGGSIEVESNVGVGSTFAIVVQLPTAAPRRPSMPMETVTASARVLLVDDDLISRKVGQAILKRIGCTTYLAADGDEAIALCREEGPFDLILMDINLPGANGFEVTEAIRKLGSGRFGGAPVIAVTAQAMKGSRESALARGMDDYIAKPITLASMRKVIGRWLKKAANSQKA